MYIVLRCVVLLSLCPVPVGGGATKIPQQGQQNIPATLDEAHAALERLLSAEELAKIDAMPSEGCMMDFVRLGQRIRHDWGLWKGGPLAEYMEGLGLTYPRDVSEVILETFWCRRHGRDLRLEERAEFYDGPKANAQKIGAKDERRIAMATAALQDRMMGLRFEQRDVPTVRMSLTSVVSTRFLCPFRDGVFLGCFLMGSRQTSTYPAGYFADPPHGEARAELGKDAYAVGYFLDPADRKIHRIGLPEIDQTYAAVVADGRAWFAGLKKREAVLVGIGDRDRIVVPLPKTDEFPDLGLDGQALLAVYSKTIYRLADRQWTLVQSGDILLPHSLLPQRYGNTVFFHDENMWGGGRRLWWLTTGEELYLSLLEQDVGLLRWGSDWNHVLSYCVTSRGDLWACIGAGFASGCLFRRSADGRYSVAVLDGSVRPGADPMRSIQTDQYVHVSGVRALPDDTLLLVGATGLYRLRGNELIQELAFAPADREGRAGRSHDHWRPNDVLAFDDGSYIVGSRDRGLYWLRPDDDGQWNAQTITMGDPVAW